MVSRQRAQDLVLVAVVAVPVMVVVAALAAAIVAVDRFNPWYTQVRVGQDGRPFTCHKLQTMRPTPDASVVADAASDARRVTRLGAWLRDHGLDELPQLLNILQGTMSFTGPRPYLELVYPDIRRRYADQADLVDDWWLRRQTVLPGLSGWHQINASGHGIVTYDLEYLTSRIHQPRRTMILVSIKIMVLGKRRYFRRHRR